VSENLLLVFFNIFIVGMLALDLGIVQRRAHFPSMKEAILWTVTWCLIAVAFSGLIARWYGTEKALQFLTGFVVEEALSVDNVFVFIIIFTYFAVPKTVQHRVLFWGVLSAIVFRAVFIVLGSALVAQFHWILYLLGAFLLFTAVKLAVHDNLEVHPERNPAIRWARKFLPVTRDYEGGKFFSRKDGKLAVTPLLLVLIMIETTDIAFATDSIPAIFAISRDPVIIYTSNILAVMGLRSLYFVVAGFLGQFRFLKYGLSGVLGFIGLKMLTETWIEVPIEISLTVIFTMLAISIGISALVKAPAHHPQGDGGRRRDQ
jgi:tellurite resistance protein TerC